MAKGLIYGPQGQILKSLDSGYGASGASYKKRSLQQFRPKSASPILDIDAHNMTLRQRSRTLYMSGGMATSAIITNRTNVVGCGLKLKARLKRHILRLEAEPAAQLEKMIEDEFEVWAKDKRSCDATGVNDFYAMQQLALILSLTSGDCFPLFKHREPKRMHPYSLRIHLIEADRVCTPLTTRKGRRRFCGVSVEGMPLNMLTEGQSEDGNRIHDGVEVDESGAIVAYHIATDYPQAPSQSGEPLEWIRVLAYGEDTGRPNILQVMNSERADQYRGVPYLAHVIEPLLQTRRYTESELMAAVVESFFTAFVKTETPDENPYNEIGPSASDDENDYELGPGAINYMKPGEDIDFADPKRPTSGFSQFMRAMSEQIGAALEVPADLLMKSFSTSYNASRAALLEAWKAFKMRREWFVSDFCDPIYAEWFAEAVALGRIDAPGFFEDPLVRDAWLGCEWIGPTQGQLDPVKEVTAKVMAINEGLETREHATIEMNGGNWEDNADQLTAENQTLAKAKAPLQAAQEDPLKMAEKTQEEAKEHAKTQDDE